MKKVLMALALVLLAGCTGTETEEETKAVSGVVTAADEDDISIALADAETITLATDDLMILVDDFIVSGSAVNKNDTVIVTYCHSQPRIIQVILSQR